MKKDKLEKIMEEEVANAVDKSFSIAFAAALVASVKVLQPTKEQLKDIIDISLDIVDRISNRETKLEDLMDDVTEMMEPVAEEIEKAEEEIIADTKHVEE